MSELRVLVWRLIGWVMLVGFAVAAWFTLKDTSIEAWAKTAILLGLVFTSADVGHALWENRRRALQRQGDPGKGAP